MDRVTHGQLKTLIPYDYKWDNLSYSNLSPFWVTQFRRIDLSQCSESGKIGKFYYNEIHKNWSNVGTVWPTNLQKYENKPIFHAGFNGDICFDIGHVDHTLNDPET